MRNPRGPHCAAGRPSQPHTFLVAGARSARAPIRFAKPARTARPPYFAYRAPRHGGWRSGTSGFASRRARFSSAVCEIGAYQPCVAGRPQHLRRPLAFPPGVVSTDRIVIVTAFRPRGLVSSGSRWPGEIGPRYRTYAPQAIIRPGKSPSSFRPHTIVSRAAPPSTSRGRPKRDAKWAGSGPSITGAVAPDVSGHLAWPQRVDERSSSIASVISTDQRGVVRVAPAGCRDGGAHYPQAPPQVGYSYQEPPSGGPRSPTSGEQAAPRRLRSGAGAGEPTPRHPSRIRSSPFAFRRLLLGWSRRCPCL